MSDKKPTCGLEDKLPKHQMVDEREGMSYQNLCCDSRACPYKRFVGHYEERPVVACLYSDSTKEANK